MLPSEQDPPQAGWGLITGDGTRLYELEDVQSMTDGSFQVTTSQGNVAQLGIVGEFRFADASAQARFGTAAPRQLGVDANLQILDVEMPFSSEIDLTDDGSVSATVDGVFDLDGEFHLAFDVGFGGLNTFSTYVGGNVYFDIGASVVAQGSASISREQAVTAPVRSYFAGAIGFVPVVVEVTTQALVGFEGSVVANASMETGVDADAEVRVGARYDSALPVGNRWSTIAGSGFDWGYDFPVVCYDGSGELRGYLRLHFEVQLYSLLGPTFDIEPYARLNGSVQGCLGDDAAAYNLALTAGAVGYAKIKADVLDLFVIESPELTVFDVSRVLAEWINELTGACCFEGAPCQEELTLSACQNVGGFWPEAGSTCDSCSETCGDDQCDGDETCASCPSDCGPCPTGACCLSNGTCQTGLTSAQCSSQGGNYQGDGTSCGNCPQPTGSCCVNGNCSTTTSASCSGSWTQGQSCSPNPCQQPTGSCCVSGSCSVTTSANCSGSWTQGQSCSPNPCTQAPANDNCANATNTGAGNANFEGSNAGATTDGSASCGSGSSRDVWWRYTPNTSGTAIIDTNPSDFDTVLSVHSSCGGTELACDDDGGTGNRSLVQVQVSAGSTYRIRVAGYNGATGTIGLNIDSPIAPQLPSKATSPNPANGTTGRSVNTDVSWSNGGGATSYDVYFGTDLTPDSGEFRGNQSGTSFDPGTLAYSTTYYWRIDSKNSTGTTTGNVWSFTTENQPVQFIDFAWSGSASIPDGVNSVRLEWNPPGNIPVNATITKVSVYHRITHTWVGDLYVEIGRKSGPSTWNVWVVRNREGGSADNIEETRTAEDYFDGKNANTQWYYDVWDTAQGDQGILREVHIYVYYTP